MSGNRGGLWGGLLPALLCLGLIVAGCGGGSSSSSSSGSSSTSDAASGAEPSREFLDPKSPNNKVVTFGKEGSAEEREEANAVVIESLEARQAADFAAQCETLTLKLAEELVAAGSPANKSVDPRGECPAALKKAAEPLSASKKARLDNLSGDIAALRVKGKNAYALYHGNDGKNYVMSLEMEHGGWKVTALLTPEV
jgi:hypothetical protein